MTHTLGEWRYEEWHNDMLGDRYPAVMCGNMVLAETFGTDADGQLMAASPKLLSACKALLAWGVTDGASMTDLIENVVALAEEAVTQAEERRDG